MSPEVGQGVQKENFLLCLEVLEKASIRSYPPELSVRIVPVNYVGIDRPRKILSVVEAGS